MGLNVNVETRDSSGTDEQKQILDAKSALYCLRREYEKSVSDLIEIWKSSTAHHRALCQQLIDQKAQIIQDIAKKVPDTAATLQKDTKYQIYNEDRRVFRTGNVTYSYEHYEDDCDPSSSRGRSAEPRQQADSPQTQYSGPPSSNVHRRSPSFASTAVYSHDQITRKAPRPLLQSFTNRTITFSEARLGHYWIFEYRTRVGNVKYYSAFYTLRCPAPECGSPVFSRHPLKNDRGEKHMRACGRPFRNVREMMSRYARIVIANKKDKPVTREKLHEHNEQLIPAHDVENLGQENLLCG